MMNTYKIAALAVGFVAVGYFAVRTFVQPPMFAKALTAAEKQNCGITAEVTEGPYYVSGMPELKDGELNFTGLPGRPLTVSGHVYEGTGDSKPIANAIAEIWHADNSGTYHPNGNGPAARYASADLALRGFVKTGANGLYRFTTIYPGEYSGRTRHIHIKIRAPGKDELTSQLIVPSLAGDALTFDADTVSQGLPNCHLLKIDSSASPAAASFDFRL
jgi:protocatechuate 3,4-dioxygenase beta subunit